MRDDLKKAAPLFFSNELFLSRMYVVWALISMILFGFFGIGTSVYNVVQKVSVYREMQKINYDLNVKLQKFAKLSEDFTVARSYARSLDTTVPQDLNTHSYMVSFMQEAAIAGFSVRNFIVSSDSKEGEVPIIVILEGPGDVTSLISGIESFQRVTIVDSVVYKELFDTREVTVNLRIFNL